MQGGLGKCGCPVYVYFHKLVNISSRFQLRGPWENCSLLYEAPVLLKEFHPDLPGKEK